MAASERVDGERLGLVCLGEALVDLICPDRVADPAAATRFEARFGGALANVAVAARRAGAPAALAGGCGADDWGRFLRGRLREEGVALDFHAELEGAVTPFAFATMDPAGEPSFRIHDEGIVSGIASLAGREAELAGGAAALVVGSNTMPDDGSRAITEAACSAARERGVRILFDPNLRPGRWRSLDAARDGCLGIAREAALLKCNLGEARWLSGRAAAGAAEAAEALVELGPELVVVTAGSAPAVARGAASAEVPAPAVDVVSPLGAGDVFMGTLAAGLLNGGWRLDEAEPAMRAAASAAAATCTQLGAFD